MKIVLIRDDSQQNAELKQAFVNHLPRRIELVQKRVQRLVRSAFDVNALTILINEIQGIAGASGRYGLMSASERLFALEQKLESVMHAAVELGDAEKAELENLSLGLDRALRQEVKVRVSIADFSPDLARLHPRHTHLAAPEEYWRRFSTLDVAPFSSDDVFASIQAPNRSQTLVDLPRAAPAKDTVAAMEIMVDDLDVSLEVPMAVPTSSSEFIRQDRDVFGAIAEQHLKMPSLDEDSDFTVAPAPLGSSVDEQSANQYQFAADEVEVDVQISTPSTPVVQPPPRAQITGTKRVFYLCENHDYFKELAAMLVAGDLTVDRIESMDELVDTLSAMTADLVIVDSAFASQLEAVADFFKALKQRTTAKIPIVAFAEANDLSARIRAMRAGIDILIPTKATASEAFAKLSEQLEQEQKLDFRIMIVEDDRSQALFAESILRKSGMETLAVTDPLNTLEALERFKPDLILMDLYMPGIDGMELTAIIREREEFISTPIVFLSGEQDSEKQFDALSAGGDDFLNKPIRPKFLISAVTNRARRARLLNAKRRAKTRDSESGLFDRSVLLERLSSALIVEDRDALFGGIVLIELDDAKSIRESFGLSGLDTLCNQIAGRMKPMLSGHEIAARYGDGNLILLCQERDVQDLETLALRACTDVCNTPADLDGKLLPFSLSAGICRFAGSLADPASMIDCAERALKSARLNFVRSNNDQDRVSIYQVPQAQSADQQLLDAIKHALANDGFQLLFQPIVSLDQTGEEQYEVLLRLRSESGAVFSALEVFECANQHEQTADIDRWMLSRCFSVIDERKRQGRAPVRLSVNQSAASLRDSQRIAWLKQTIETRRIDARSLCLEFPMADIMQELRSSVPFFQAAKQIGIMLTLENFESSLTALQVLSYLPVDHIKISSKYIDSAATTREELKALIKAAHDGKRKVIAAKVESAQMASLLWQMGIDYLQGNFVQQPGAELGFDFRGASH